MRETLRAGGLGVRLEMPASLTLVRDEDSAFELRDPDTGVTWLLLSFPGLPLVLAEEHRAELAGAMERHARAMFEATFEQLGGDRPERPRTSDPAWSPMVDVEHLVHQGAPILRTIHRMVYQPGLEVMMGHVMVPLEGGLFEARATAFDQLTGMRESVLIDALLRSKPDDEPSFLPQREMDDPRHDTAFPQHALSRVRTAQRWLLAESGLEILRPAVHVPGGEVALPRLGCALTPPPRFVHQPDQFEGRAEHFRRTSFCGTDGVESFLVECHEAELGRLAEADLRWRAQSTTRAIHERADVSQLEVHVHDLPLADGSGVLVVAEGMGHVGPLRNVLCWMLDEGGRPWTLAVTGSADVPVAVRAGELRAAASSWRLTALPPARRKPRWRFW